MTVQHQLEVYILVNKLCQLSKKGVHVIVSNLLWYQRRYDRRGAAQTYDVENSI